MIYGYDEPVALPTVDLYDTAMMQMYVNAAREQYTSAREELKEFLKMYGDFFSPFAKDNERWYNSTIGPVLLMMLEASARGIDLTRSPEGRALLASSLRNIPYADLANMRRNAKAGEEYLKNRAALIQAGKYSPELEQWDLERNGLPAFEDWDSSMGAWTRSTPLTYQTLHDFVSPLVDNTHPGELSQSEVESFGMAYDPRNKYIGTSRDMLRNPIVRNIPGLIGNPIYDFYYDRARRDLIAKNGDPNYKPTDQEILNQFTENALDSVPEYLVRPTSKADDWAKMAQDHAYDMQKQDRAFAQQLKIEGMKEAAANKRQRDAQNFETWKLQNDPKNNPQIPLSYTEMLDDASMSKRKETAGLYDEGLNSNQIASNIKQIISFNESIHKNRKGDVKYGKTADWWRRNAFDEKGNLDVNKMKKAGIINKKGQLSSVYHKAFQHSQQPNKYTGTSGANFLQTSNDYYVRNFAIPVSESGTESARISIKAFAGEKKTKYNDTGALHEQIIFGPQYSYTPYRRALVASTSSVSGGTKLRTTSLYSRFNKFLKDSKFKGWYVGNEIGYAMIDLPGRTQRDFYSTISVPREKLDKFINAEAKSTGKSYDEVLGELNLTAYDSLNKKLSNKKLYPALIAFVHIPVTKTFDNRDSKYALSNFDTEYDKKTYGSKATQEYAPYRQASSINR